MTMFFFELGANDGVRFSNTIWLEKHKNWKGLLIEPLPRRCKQARRNRRNSIVVNSACVAYNFPEHSISIVDVDLMSMVAGDGMMLSDEEVENRVQHAKELQDLYDAPKLTVPARPLSDILDEYNIKHIDFLSIDVEGYEL